VRLPARTLAERLPPDCAIASDNAPSLSVLSGPSESVERLRTTLEAEGVFCRPLLTSHAFHSPMMDPAVEPFTALVRGVALAAPRIPFVSTLTGTWIRDEQAMDPEYWGRHLRATVRFADAARELISEPRRVLVEVGPRATLTTLARQQSADPARLVAVPTLGDSADDDAEWQSVVQAVGRLWLSGAALDWESYYAEEQRRRVPLPTYPFERKRYWVEPRTLLLGERAEQRAARSNQESEAAVPEPAAAAGNGASGKPSELVARVCAVVEAVSGIRLQEADPTASFVELGLDSLALTQVAQRLQKICGKKITMRDLVQSRTTLNALTEYLEDVQPAVAPESRGAQSVAAGARRSDVETGKPPVPGARLGRDRNGNPAWFVPHPEQPGKYVKLETLDTAAGD